MPNSRPPTRKSWVTDTGRRITVGQSLEPLKRSPGFLADGLFDISYGPKDVVLLDGNIVHGITGLRDTPGKGMATRRELERFSATAVPFF